MIKNCSIFEVAQDTNLCATCFAWENIIKAY